MISCRAARKSRTGCNVFLPRPLETKTFSLSALRPSVRRRVLLKGALPPLRVKKNTVAGKFLKWVRVIDDRLNCKCHMIASHSLKQILFLYICFTPICTYVRTYGVRVRILFNLRLRFLPFLVSSFCDGNFFQKFYAGKSPSSKNLEEKG